MTKIKLLILDIDGTIAGMSNQINETIIQSIEKIKNKGIQVGLATGRMYCSALRFYHTIKGDLPIIAYNGAWIQNPKDEEIYSHIPLPKEIALELLEYYQQPEWQDEVEVHFYLDDQLYVQTVTENTQYYCQRSQVKPNLVEDLHSLLKVNPTKVLALCHNPDLTKKLALDLQQRYPKEKVFLTQSNPIYLEATHSSVNKGNAIKYLAQKVLNVSPQEIMAIGDNFNDLTMLEYAGISIAMGNAPDEVKQKVDWVSKDVENDGVKVAIEKFLL